MKRRKPGKAGRSIKAMTVGARGRLDLSAWGGWKAVELERAIFLLSGAPREEMPPGVAELERWRDYMDPWAQPARDSRRARDRLEDRRDVMRNVLCAASLGTDGKYMSIEGLVRVRSGEAAGRFGKLVVDDDGDHGAWIDLLAGGRILLSEEDIEPWTTPLSRHLAVAIQRTQTARQTEAECFKKARESGLACDIANAVHYQRHRLRVEAELVEAELGEVKRRWSAGLR